MDGMIEVRRENIGGGEVNAVSARDLHAFLEVGKDFSTWIRSRIDKFEFMQGVDFIQFTRASGVFPKTGKNPQVNSGVFPETEKNPLGGRPAIEYVISLDMAKQLAMVERSKKGRMARQYFIECERRLNEVVSPPLVQIQADPLWLQEAQATLKFGDLLGCPRHITVSETAKRVRMLDGPDFTAHIGALPSSQNILAEEVMLEPTPLGKLFGLSAQAMNQKLAVWGWQYKTGELWEPTDVGAPHSYKHQWASGSKTGYNLKWKVEAVKARMREE